MERIVTTNRRASHDYFILETLEAGIVLTGAEVKSIRAGKISLTDAFVGIRDSVAILKNAQIVPYEKGSYFNSEAKCDRKLLLHQGQIDKWAGKIGREGLSCIPLKVYFTGGLIKIEIALVKGKKTYDKRQSLKERDIKREMDRARGR